MEKDTFSIENDREPAAGKSQCLCPLASIPADVWRNLLHVPFRRRHPWIFWLLAILIIALAVIFASRWFADDDDLAVEDCLALVRVQGPIMNAEPTLEWIRKLENTPQVKGVLVRVDSPGGGAAASQEIYAGLARLSQRMPIAVSMGSMAASGGYMLSMAGHRIFANPSTVTGSIGVRMDIPQLQGLFDKIGVGQETLVTAPFKDAASYLHPLTPQDRAYLQGVIENMHAQFVDIVAKGRKMEREKAAQLANGKIYTGQEALALGLIDALGGYDDALNWLAAKTGLPPERKLLKKRKKTDSLLAALFSQEGELEKAATGLLEVLGGKAGQPSFLYQ